MAKPPVPIAQEGAVAAFLARAAAVPALRAAPSPARLLFGVDATASRQPSWDHAASVQAEMFGAAEGLGTGRLAVSLAYYRGQGEFAATPYLSDARTLAERMSRVTCAAGHTQILRLLRHAEAEATSLRALVFVGDALEEAPGPILDAATRLGVRRVPAFVFQEGDDPVATPVLREVARRSGGAWAPFDHRSPGALAALLRGAAAYASGGREALARLPGGDALLTRLPAPPMGGKA